MLDSIAALILEGMFSSVIGIVFDGVLAMMPTAQLGL
jgi:hypothetical protein